MAENGEEKSDGDEGLVEGQTPSSDESGRSGSADLADGSGGAGCPAKGSGGAEIVDTEAVVVPEEKPGVAAGDVAGVVQYVSEEAQDVVTVTIAGPTNSSADVNALKARENARILEAVLDGFTGFEIGGRTLDEWVMKAYEFFDRDALGHEAARASLAGILREAVPEMADEELDWEQMISPIPTEVFYSSAPARFEEDRAMSMQRASEGVRSRWEAWDSDEHNPNHFFRGRRGFDPRKALAAPRVIKCEHLKAFGLSPEEFGNDLNKLLARIQQYQLLFLTVCSEKVAQWEFLQGGGKKSQLDGSDDERASLHRVSNIFAQIIGLLCQQLKGIGPQAGLGCDDIMREIPEDEDKFRVPAAASLFFERNDGDMEKVDEYIRATLSLLFPDRDRSGSFTNPRSGDMRFMVNEDMVLMNLMVLARDFNLYEKYKDVFKAVFYYRRLQNVRALHWEPKKLTVDPDPGRISLKSLVDQFWRKHHRAPTVLSFGYGDAMLERYILSRVNEAGEPLVAEILGVDIDYGEDFANTSAIEDDNCERMIRLNVGVRDRIRENDSGGYEEDSLLMNDIINRLPEADIVIACDSLHETSKPLPYAVSLYGKVNSGGYFYVADPVHCRALDDVTHVSVHPFDKTKWQDSMSPLESMYNLVHWLTSVEGAYSSGANESIVPGSFGGNNDTYWRLVMAFQRLSPEERDRYIVCKMPDERELWTQDVSKDEDIFKMWPFTLVKDQDRTQVLNGMLYRMRERGGDVGGRKSLVLNKEGRPDMTFQGLKSQLIQFLLSKSDIDTTGGNARDAAMRRIWERVPFRKAEKMIHETAGGKNPRLILENHLAGEVRVLVELVRELTGIELDLGPNW